ncbi:MAG TPA: glycine/betaine ABC transporter substrate-binding protein [Actinobacteria bacterium]|nr:glycine/betaine ABC transporter substrate-binding protein [Actinomycetota bacterium]
MRRPIRSRAVGAVLVALALVVSACGDDGSGDGTKEGPTITVGSFDFGESVILGEIYAQALEAAGYPVSRAFNLGTRDVVNPALKSGEVDLIAEYTGSLLFFKRGTPSADNAATYAAMAAAIADDGLVALAYAPAEDKNGFVVTAETAAALGVTKVSDLAAYNGTLILGGPTECPDRPLCLPGLQEVYGLDFASFRPLDAAGPITVAALEGGEIDVAVLFTSDGMIAAKGFVLLEDDRNLQPAENIVPITTDEIIAAYGDDLVALLNAVTAAITTAELSELNKSYSIDATDADTLARQWLEDHGFI